MRGRCRRWGPRGGGGGGARRATPGPAAARSRRPGASRPWVDRASRLRRRRETGARPARIPGGRGDAGPSVARLRRGAAQRRCAMALALGIDIAKRTFVAALWRDGRGQAVGAFPNTPEGFAGLRARLVALLPAEDLAALPL